MMGYYIIGAKSLQERLFTDRGVQRGFPLCQGSGGVPQILNSLMIGGYKGLKRD
jgi:hypothetical protein